MSTDSEKDGENPNQEVQGEVEKTLVNPNPNSDLMEQYEKKMTEMFDKFNDKVSEITQNYDKKIEELNSTIKQKDEEIQKQKELTAKIVMNSSQGKGSDEPDFSRSEFDEIDWDKQASKYIGKIDKKLLGLN